MEWYMCTWTILAGFKTNKYISYVHYIYTYIYHLPETVKSFLFLLCGALLILVFDTVITDASIAIIGSSKKQNKTEQKQKKKNTQPEVGRMGCVICGFNTEFQRNCKMYAISSTILFL